LLFEENKSGRPLGSEKWGRPELAFLSLFHNLVKFKNADVSNSQAARFAVMMLARTWGVKGAIGPAQVF